MVVALATLGALGLGEIAVRALGLAPGIRPIEVVGDTTVYRRSTNPILGFELKANYRNQAADLISNYPSTNSHGQRDLERTVAKPAGTKRIVMLGDSVVEGVGIREIDDTLSRQLELLYAGESTEVLNFGVSGYCTLAEVELLETKALEFAPDVVILVFVENDFQNFNRHAFQMEAAVERPQIVKSLFRRSKLFRLSCIKLNLFNFGAEMDPVDWNRRAIGENNVNEGLARLSELADRHGFETIIAIWPRFSNDAITDIHTMPDNPRELVIERLARMHGIKSVRLSSFFQRHWDSMADRSNPRRFYSIGDKIHPSIEGGRVAAQALKTILDDFATAPQAGAPPPASTPPSDHDQAAIQAAKAQGRTEPDYSRIHKNTGNTLKRQGKLEEAINEYRKALQIKPDYAEAHYSLGNALAAQGKLAEAIKHYRLAIQFKPDFAKAHSNLATSLYKQGRVDKAIAHFREAVRIDPDLVEARVNLARLQGAGN